MLKLGRERDELRIIWDQVGTPCYAIDLAENGYPALARIIAELAPRHGLVYRELGYGQLHASQQAFLRAMGQPPAQS